MRAAGERRECPDLLQSSETPSPDRAGRFRGILDRTLVRWIDRVISWRKCARDRRLLASHNDRLLRDIGIDRFKVEDESTASFWRWR